MSTTTPVPEPVLLSQDQADRILKYALENRMYETGSGGLEAIEPQTRLNDAATLAFQAKRAADNGNQSEQVKEVLFIAEVEMKPIEGSTNGQATSPSPAPPAPAASPPPAADPYADSTDEQLDQALQVFRASPPNPAIQAEITKIEAALSQRRSPSAQADSQPQPAQEVAPPAPAPAAPPAPAASAPVPAGQPAPPVPGGSAVAGGGPEPHVPPPHTDLPPVPGLQNSGVISPGGVPDTPGAQAQPPAPDAQPVAGGPSASAGAEGSVASAQAPAQDGDRAQLLSQLTWDMMTAYGLTIDTAQQLSDDQIRSIIANPAGLAAPAAVQAPSPASVSPERESFEARVTGPMLKAWGRGRKDVPDLSDEELRTMVENPTGPPAAASVASPPVQSAQASAPAPPSAAVPDSAPALAPVSPAAQPPVERPPSDPGQVSDAMAIIQREHFPIPPDIDDPYRLPNDVSKVSDEELRSLHARAHAVESRVNWVISERDDEVGDLERLLADRRRTVKLETPTTVDGKRRTKDQIEAEVENDAEVQRLKSQIADVQKGTGKLKVIRDNAHRDCERLSRQWSMRFKEENASPTR